jgi:hypothetical protein
VLIGFIHKLCGGLLGIGDFGVALFVATFHYMAGRERTKGGENDE